MAIKIAVCDDEFSAASRIDLYLSQIQQETGQQFQAFYFSSGEELLRDMPRDIRVLLLDIQMATVSGIEVARQLRREGAEFFLFFITSHVQYALAGYEVHAYAFLQKPLQYAHLKRYLLEVVQLIHNARPITLQLKSGTGMEIVDCSDILYIEVYGHSSTAVFSEKRANYQISLNELDAQLCSHGFFRCHKSYLINLRRIRSVRTACVVMTNGDTVPLSKYRKQEFLLALQEVIGE